MRTARSLIGRDRPFCGVAGSWLLIFGLFLQLMTAATCTVALSDSAFGADASSPFPLCHAATDGDATSVPGGPHHSTSHPCSFCCMHGQATPVASPLVAISVPAAVPAPMLAIASATAPVPSVLPGGRTPTRSPSAI